MKLNQFILPAVVGASLISLPCDAKQAAAQLVGQAAPAEKSGALAAKVGIAAHLPQSTEGFFSVYQLGDTFDRLLKTQLGTLLVDTAKEAGTDIKKELQGMEAQMVRAVLGEEIFLAFGKGAGEQGANLTALSKVSNYGNGKMMVDMISQEIARELGEDAGDSSEFGDSEEAMFAAIMKDPKKILDIFEKSELPPVLVGIKVSNADQRNGFAAMVAGKLAEATKEKDAPIEALEAEKHGVKLTGFRVSGKKAAALLEKEDLTKGEKILGSAENVKRFVKLVSSKDVVVATGVKGDYILVYAGASLDGFELVDSPEKSLLAHEEMGFLSNYADKDIRLLTFAPKKAYEALGKDAEMIASLAQGVKDGLAGTKVFGDTRDVQRLLDHMSKLDADLMGSFTYDGYGAVGFREDGFKVESHGGSHIPSPVWKTEHRFASASELDGVAFISNSVGDEKLCGIFTDMIETAGEAAYLMARRVSEMNVDDGDFKQFKQGFGLVDSLFKKDLLQVWTALSGDLGEGLGNEGALIVDLNGSMPTVPMVPNAIVKNGKIPRIAFAATVKDSAKLGQSWERLNASLTSILEKSQQLGAPPIPMPAPFTSDSDGLKNHFFTIIPFTTPNAMPSISTSDEFFFMSTSPKFSGELAKAAKSGKVKRTGGFAQINFKSIHNYAAEWLELVNKNQDELFKDNEFAKGDFVENLPMIRKALKAAEELEDITYHAREEGGKARGSFHFNMK